MCKRSLCFYPRIGELINFPTRLEVLFTNFMEKIASGFLGLSSNGATVFLVFEGVNFVVWKIQFIAVFLLH